MINFKNSLKKILKDIEESSPKLRNTLKEISPISFCINLKGHKKIFISIDGDNSNISFEENDIQFEINGSLIEIIYTIVSGKINKSLIKGERSGIINTSKKNVRFYNTINGKIIGEINNGTIIKLKKCKINWCQISKNNITGWVIKKNIWGVEKKEVFNIGYFEIFFDYYYKSLNFLEKVVEGM